MKLRGHWNRFVARMNQREQAWNNKYFDVHTYDGNIRAFFFWCAVTLLMWNIYEILAWWDGLWGIVTFIDPGQQRWARIWATIIGGAGLSVPLIAITVLMLKRKSFRSSGDGDRSGR